MKYRISRTYGETIYMLKIKEIEALVNSDTLEGNTQKAWQLIYKLKRSNRYFYTIRYNFNRCTLEKYYWKHTNADH